MPFYPAMPAFDGAKVALGTCLGVRKGERVMVLIDPTKEAVGTALFEAAIEAGADVVLVKVPAMSHEGQEPPLPVARMMREMDVVIAATERSISHTIARRVASKEGARIVTMPGITEEMLREGGMTADFREIHKEAKRLQKRLKGSSQMKLVSDAGTDLSLSVKGRHWFAEDTGLCHRKGEFTNLPAGEIFVSPVEGTAEGTLVVDGSFRGMLAESVNIEVKEGFAVKIRGATEVVRELNKGGKEGRNLAKVGIGLNPKARIIGRELEDAKMLGAVSVGFGDSLRFGGRMRSPIYIESVMTKTTLALDNQVVVKSGKVVA
jgi:leucyl aminopeptidase (aminopeptidase T)